MVVTSAARDLERHVLVRLPPALGRRWLFLRVHHRWPRLSSPRTFSEKVNWRILNDRRPLLAWTCDKLAMKEHASSSGADVVVPRTLWKGGDVRELAEVDLPTHWVLKPSHRSGLVHFGDARTDLGRLRRRTEHWLADVQHGVLGEWAYGQARPCLFVEELVGSPQAPPPDYKVFVFAGEPLLVQVDLDRFSGHRRSLYDPQWRRVDARLGYPDGGPVPRPAGLSRLLDVARTLGADFDFVRIDLYLAGETGVVFGEYTPYPGSGLERFDPRSFDAWLGAQWKLPRDVSARAATA